jgi:transcriptional regulator with XRE-family HTH domain
MDSRLAEKLASPDYRKAFVASQINIGIPFQIRGLLKSRRGWTQKTLAELTGMLQPRISGLMTPGKVRPNIETLRRIAEAFDCGLIVRFAPFSEMAKWSEDFNPEEFGVPDFEHDTGFIERMPVASAVPEYGQMQAQQAVGFAGNAVGEDRMSNVLQFSRAMRSAAPIGGFSGVPASQNVEASR